MVRKEPKGHGTNQYIEGPVKPGDTAVIVEDVVTTGGSSLQAIQRAEQFGLKILGVLAIIDRMEGGAEAFAQRGYRLSSLLTIRDFGIEPPR
jgi:orotate phosphoribosyltransferase